MEVPLARLAAGKTHDLWLPIVPTCDYQLLWNWQKLGNDASNDARDARVSAKSKDRSRTRLGSVHMTVRPDPQPPPIAIIPTNVIRNCFVLDTQIAGPGRGRAERVGPALAGGAAAVAGGRRHPLSLLPVCLARSQARHPQPSTPTNQPTISPFHTDQPKINPLTVLRTVGPRGDGGQAPEARGPLFVRGHARRRAPVPPRPTPGVLPGVAHRARRATPAHRAHGGDGGGAARLRGRSRWATLQDQPARAAPRLARLQRVRQPGHHLLLATGTCPTTRHDTTRHDTTRHDTTRHDTRKQWG